eukprot:gene8625-6214_t
MMFKVHVLSTQRTDSFFVDVQDVDQGRFAWQIEKLYDDFKHLKSSMKDRFTEGSPTWKSMALFPTPESLKNFLTSALSFLGEGVWDYEPMLNFLDNVPQKSFISEIKIGKLMKKVDTLETRCVAMEKSHSQLLESFEAFQAKVNQLLSPEEGRSLPLTSARLSNDSRRNSNTSVLSKTLDPHLSVASMGTIDSGLSGDNECSQQAIDALLQGDDPNDYLEDYVVTAQRTPVSSSEYAPTRASIALTTVHTGNNASAESSLPSSIYLPSELLSTVLAVASAPHPFEPIVDAALLKIAPVELQINHRQSVVLLLKRLIRIALGSTAFEYGVQTTKCLLPDDPIKITVMLSKASLPTWHTVLCDYLTTYAEKANSFGGSSFVPPDEEEQNLDPYFHDLAPAANHFLGNVSHVKQNLMHSVTLIVDSIVIEITSNNRPELCLTSFVEEVSLIVGTQELFKRSLLLIRGWWALETQTYLGCSIRHYLSDFHLFVMLTGVFNQYATHIKTPMVAFCFFLAEYSGYDGISKAISIRGFAPFQTKTSNQPQVPEQKPHHVIPESLLEKYWVLYNISHAQEQQEQHNRKRSHSSSDDEPAASDPSSPGSRGQSLNQTPEALAAVAAAIASGAAPSLASPSNDVSPSPTSFLDKMLTDAVRESMKALSTNNLFLFDRSSYNIVHPLCHTNMITEKLSQRRISRLAKAFQSGAVAVAAILRANSSSQKSSQEIEDTMNACFANIRAFNNLWNQGQQSVDLVSVMKQPFDLVKMIQSIQYSNLMIESAVNDEGLLILTQEILAVKGPLPVGEIGKILAETTNIPNLSIKLKERYGGLKKYLETFPDRFVISTDHPFNPNVLLRCSLAPEHLEMIEKGNFPHHIVARAKKASAAAAAARRKKSNPNVNVPVVTNVDPSSFTTNLPTSPAGFSPNAPTNAAYRVPGVGANGLSSGSSVANGANGGNMVNVATLTPQQQNLVHATVQKLKNIPSNGPNVNGGGGALSPPNGGGSTLPFNAPGGGMNAGANGGGHLYAGANGGGYYGNASMNYADDGSYYTNTGVRAASTGGNLSNNGTMRFGSVPYHSGIHSGHSPVSDDYNSVHHHHHAPGLHHHVQQQQASQASRLSGAPSTTGVDISAYTGGNGAMTASHWSQQGSRRSSTNSDYGDISPIGSGTTSNSNSNTNSLNLSGTGSLNMLPGSRDSVRNLFGNGPNPFAALSGGNPGAKSLFGDSGSAVGLGFSLTSNGNPGVVGGGSRPNSLAGHDSSVANPSYGFVGGGLFSSSADNSVASLHNANNNANNGHDLTKLGLDIDVLALTSQGTTSGAASNNNNNNSSTTPTPGNSSSGYGGFGGSFF